MLLEQAEAEAEADLAANDKQNLIIIGWYLTPVPLPISVL